MSQVPGTTSGRVPSSATSDVRPPRRANRSWWMEEALANDPGQPCPPLAADTTADVVVLGGGYTGMWTAYFLKERNPALDVVLLERDVCGAGPSGRNGGFLSGMWDKLYTFTKHFGDDRAINLCEVASRSIAEIGSFCEDHGVDAWFNRSGDIAVATSPAQEGSWTWTLDNARENGVGHLYRELTRDEVQARCSSPVFGGGMLVLDTAHVQPARLARGLRRVLLERGVRIYEGTPAVRYDAGPTVRVQTPRGRVSATHGVVALGAYAVDDPHFSRELMPLASYMVATAPAPEKLAEIGWTGGEGLYDFRWALHYVRTTNDGRIVFGSPTYGPWLTSRVDYDPAFTQNLARDLVRWFPSFADVEIECGWGGPIDSVAKHMPFFGTKPSGNLHYGLGFMGEGIGPTHLAGRILSGLVVGADDEYTSLPIVGVAPRRFPPKAVLKTGAFFSYKAIVRKDAAEDRGQKVGRVTEYVAGTPGRFGY